MIKDYEKYMDDSTICTNKIEACLNELTPRERFVIKRYSGLTTGCPMTLDEIGAIMNIESPRVRQIMAKAIRKIKNYQTNEGV